MFKKMLARKNGIRITRVGAITLSMAAILATVVYSQTNNCGSNGYILTKLTPNTAYLAPNAPQLVVSARLTRYFGGTPISAQKLRPFIITQSYSVPLGVTYTDNNGVASATILRGALPSVPYAITWRYDGNGLYMPPQPVTPIVTNLTR